MPSDLDIFRTAGVLIREHGEDAALEAGQRADAMLAKGDMEGRPKAPKKPETAGLNPPHHAPAHGSASNRKKMLHRNKSP